MAEIPRLLLAAADVKYTDDRIAFVRNADGSVGGDWPALKESMPYKQVPVFKYNGTVISQSSSIIRFIAKQYHLDGDNEIDSAIVDSGFEAILDARKAYFTVKSDAEKVAKFWATGLNDQLALIAKNIPAGSASSVPWFNGKRMTYADVAIYYTLWVLNTENSEAVQLALKENPKVAAIFTAVETSERIAKYLAARPVTPM